MSFFIRIIFAIFIGMLAGCDNRQVLKSEDTPFSVGGITLGMLKSDLQKKHELLSCNPDTQDKAKCFVDDRKVAYNFFGTQVGFLEIKMLDPYTKVTELHFSIKGGKIKRGDVERAWNIHDKCLDKAEIDTALKFDSQTSSYFARSLDEFHLLPSGYEDFICLMPDHSFIKYSQYSGKSEARVAIYYLKDIFITNYNYIFQSKEKYANAKTEINLLTESTRTATRTSAQPLSEPDKTLIDRIEKLNSQCRGGSGDDPKTQQACDQREAAIVQARNSGWCWGSASNIGTEKYWIKCE